MNKYKDVIHIMGKEIADEWLLPSGSAYLMDDVLYYHGVISGTFDPCPNYLQLDERKRKPDLWKCHCGRVHRFPDELECEVCGAPITEKSRFVLE